MKNQHINTKKEEIIRACEKLYDKYNFKDITLKLISEQTPFSRPTIYNYFETKEEIFLAIFEQEYRKWGRELNDIKDKNDNMTKDEFASALAHTIENKERLLKLLSMNMYDLEENSRLERLIEFKKAYGEAVNTVKECLNKFFTNMSETEIINIVLIEKCTICNMFLTKT